VWLAAAFCGVGATAVAFLCMVWAQRVVSEARAAILLVLEPVFAGVLGYLAGERLGLGGAAGAALIVLAVLVAELGPHRRPDRRPA
jgi:drug/metabolite transporter (DMT)-like permease